MITWIFKKAISVLTGGTLEKMLSTVDKWMDNEVTKEEVKAEVTKTWINAQANLLVGRTWWFQLFFVLPFGLWLTAAIIAVLGQAYIGWSIQMPALPAPLDEWAGWIISSIFIVDQTKAIIGRLKK